jgi:SAM-dependent methyltransferase
MARNRSKNPKRVVRNCYNEISERFEQFALEVRQDERQRYTQLLLDRLEPGACVLELGCGSGLPTTRELSEEFDVTAVDLSPVQLERARANAPNASFLCADMTGLQFAPFSFDAVISFYAFFHLPRTQQRKLINKISTWLKPGGLLALTMGTTDTPALFEELLGAESYVSSYDSETNKQIVSSAGLELITAREETAEEFGEPVTFLWVVARKPSPED